MLRQHVVVAVLALLLLTLASPAAAEIPVPDAATRQVLRAAVLEVERDHPRYHVDLTAGWFVVATDGSRAAHQKARGVVTQAVRSLYLEYFEASPTAPLPTFVLPNAAAYRRFVVSVYGDEGPALGNLGFFDPGRRLLILNHGPGPGTLAHELVHPLLRHDFPQAPAWLDEGFAALYEHKTYQDGRMKPFVNWRMRHLRARARDLSLHELMTSSTGDVYGRDSGLYYAMGRHFLMHLHRQGHLAAFYRAYRDDFAADPTGITQLERVVGQPLATIEAAFWTWVERHR